jgi:hypothetical protein
VLEGEPLVMPAMPPWAEASKSRSEK